MRERKTFQSATDNQSQRLENGMLLHIKSDVTTVWNVPKNHGKQLKLLAVTHIIMVVDANARRQMGAIKSNRNSISKKKSPLYRRTR